MKRAIPLLLLLSACRKEETHAPKAPAAASVQNPVKEGDLAFVALAPEALARLKIVVEPLQSRKVERFRALGGEALVPPGRDVTLQAPLAGTLAAPEGGVPATGQEVRRGQAIFALAPFLTAEARATLAASRVDAEGAILSAKAQLEAAKIAFDRAERLLQEKAGSQRAVDEARAQRDIAQAAHQAAERRRDLLAAAEAGTLGPVPITAPFDGVLENLHGAPGQQVTAGGALCRIAALDRLWIRVPVYVGDVPAIDGSKEVRVSGPGEAPGPGCPLARPVAAPPSADRTVATADLYYEVDNKGGSLRPGQRVGVTLPLRSEEWSKVVQWSAVIHDVHGAAWVYEQTDALKFTRRRVEVRAVEGDVAVLSRGPDVGARIVTVGAQELYSTEFFVSK